MKNLRLSILLAAAVAITGTSHAQTPAATTPATGTPATPAAKPRPFSSADSAAYVKVAEAMQMQLSLSARLRSKFKEGEPEILAMANKIQKETTDLWTPGVNLAQERGVDAKKIPLDISKNDKAAIAKIGTIKDEKKWLVTYFEMFSKESKKGAKEAETAAKTAQDADLKAWTEKTAAALKTQSETVDAKFKEVKARK